MGASRGAYTARTLNGMIYKSGLIKDAHKLSPEELSKQAKKAFDFYRNDAHPQSEEAGAFRAENSYATRPKINMGIFDTVGSLGIPTQFKFLNKITKWRYDFHDTTLNKNTDTVYNAVALDEQRKNFIPTPMELVKSATTKLVERYFAGDHSAVIGGDAENKGVI